MPSIQLRLAALRKTACQPVLDLGFRSRSRRRRREVETKGVRRPSRCRFQESGTFITVKDAEGVLSTILTRTVRADTACLPRGGMRAMMTPWLPCRPSPSCRRPTACASSRPYTFTSLMTPGGQLVAAANLILILLEEVLDEHDLLRSHPRDPRRSSSSRVSSVADLQKHHRLVRHPCRISSVKRRALLSSDRGRLIVESPTSTPDPFSI